MTRAIKIHTTLHPMEGELLVLELPTQLVTSLREVIEVKEQFELAIRQLVMNFEKRTGLPIVSIHSHEARESMTMPFWKATVRLP